MERKNGRKYAPVKNLRTNRQTEKKGEKVVRSTNAIFAAIENRFENKSR